MRRYLLSFLLVVSFACGSVQKEATRPKAPVVPDSSGLMADDFRATKPDSLAEEVNDPIKILIGQLRFSMVVPDELWVFEENTDPNSPIVFQITNDATRTLILHVVVMEAPSLKDVAEGLRKSMENSGFTTGSVAVSKDQEVATFSVEKTDGQNNFVKGKAYVLPHPALSDVTMVFLATWPEAMEAVSLPTVDAIIGSIEPLQ